MCQCYTRNTEDVNTHELRRDQKNMGLVGADHYYHWHRGKEKKFKQGKVYDKVKNKIYLKRTQLLRGFPGRESVCLGKYARVDSGFGVCEDVESRCIE